MKLQVQSYLVVVTKAEFAANIGGYNSYVASEFDFIPLGFMDIAQDGVEIGL